jgi:hypothetical protein
LQGLTAEESHKLKRKLHLRTSWSKPQETSATPDSWHDLNEGDLGSFFWGITSDPLQEWLVNDSWPQNTTEALSQWLTSRKKINSLAPHAYLFEISAEEFHNSGANAVEEIAFLLAKAHEYTTTIQHNWQPQNMVLDWLTRIRFVIPTSHEIYMQIAKLRAFRILWANIQSQYQSSSNTTLQAAYVHSPGAMWNKSILDQETNLLRSAYEAFAAFMGGANSLSVQPYNQLKDGYDPFGQRLARNTALILKKEAKLDIVTDPLAGSYAVEHLSQELAQKAWSLFQQIDGEGGYLKAWEQGLIPKLLEQSRNQLQEQIHRQERVLVGINRFPNTLENITFDPQSTFTTPKQKNQLFRAALPFEKARLATESYTQQGNNRPDFVFLPLDGKSPSPDFQKIIELLLIAGFEQKELPDKMSPEKGLQNLPTLPMLIVLQGAPTETTSWDQQHNNALFADPLLGYLADEKARNFFDTSAELTDLERRGQILELAPNALELLNQIQAKLHTTLEDS